MILEHELVQKLVLDLAHSIPSSPINFYLLLSSLFNLEELTLSRQASSWDDEFYQVLAKLPLHKLVFGLDTLVSRGGP